MLKLVEFVHGSLAASVKTARGHSDLTPGHPEAAQAEHEAIYQAIEAGDPDAARSAVRSHMEGAAQRLGIRIGVSAAVGKHRKAGKAP
jgi:GntR family transcriptional repressor for pyruvate dehydrogenase complex